MPTLPEIDELLRLQRRIYGVVSHCESREWGAIGLSTDNPHSHDSNHAYLDAPLAPDLLPAVLREATELYTANGLEPRVRYHVPPHSPELEIHAAGLGWRADRVEETWRAWPVGAGPSDTPEVPDLAISIVDRPELEGILSVYSEDVDEATAFRHRQSWSALAADAQTDCLLASVSGEPVGGLACVWNGEWGSIERVRTRRRFRRRGICSAMMGLVQNVAVERGARGLLLYDSDAAPDRIYARAGFQFVARLTHVQLTLVR